MKIKLEQNTILAIQSELNKKMNIVEINGEYYIDTNEVQDLIEDLLGEIENQKMEIEEIENERDYNYRQLTDEEQYG